MIKTELRIGNYIYGVSDRIETINELHAEYVETAFRGGLLHYCKYDDISPIELTQEVLLKCGFSNTITSREGQYKQYGIKSKSWDFMFEFYNNGKPGAYLDMVGIEIYYLHQLQNIHFALTNTELTINP